MTLRRPQRILLVRSYISAEPDAVTAAVVTLGRAFEAKGHLVAALVARNDPDKQEITEIVAGRRLGKQLRKFRILEQSFFLLSSVLWLLRNRGQWDVVITVDTPPGVGFVPHVANSFTKQKVRHIAWVLDLFRLESLKSGPRGRAPRLNALRDRAYLIIEKRSLRHARSVVTIGECMREVLARELRVASVSIPLMVESAGEPTSPTEGGHLFHGGYVGSRSAWAIVALGLELLQEPASLVMTGGGGNADHMASQTIGSVAVRRHGFLEKSQYLRLAREASVHIVSLADHATGTSVPSRGYSAMAMGKAVVYVGDARGQLAVDLDQANAGWVVQTPAALASALREAIATPGEAERRGRNGKEFIVDRRSPERLYSQWAELLVSSEPQV